MDEERSATSSTVAPPEKWVPLGTMTKLAYSTGHILNDLCAAMWFTYLLLFFHFILGFDNSLAGVVMLSGQIVDGVATVVAGYFIDKANSIWLCNQYGRKKTWHLIGTLCVLMSFPFIFSHCLLKSYWSSLPSLYLLQTVYFVFFVAIFQFGWAATQISHLSMIPALSSSTSERAQLTSMRYGATVISTIAVYVMIGSLLGFDNDKRGSLADKEYIFQYTAWSCVGFGGLMSILFHLTLKLDEKEASQEDSGPLINDDTITDEESEDIEQALHVEDSVSVLNNKYVQTMRICDWFKEPQFYQVALIYMSTRLFTIISQSYIPLYVGHTLNLPSFNVALVPLIMFVTGFLVSLVNGPIARLLGRKGSMVLGCLLGVGVTVWTHFGHGHYDQLQNVEEETSFTKYQIYAVAAVFGAAGSQMLITSLSFVADLIAENVESSAFVYGCMSLVDKFSNGITIEVIQMFLPEHNDQELDSTLEKGVDLAYKNALVWPCLTAAILGLTAVGSLAPVNVGTRRRRNQSYFVAVESPDSLSESPLYSTE